jgi:alkyl hydroperoxide reductase subunit AhpF
MLLSDADRRTVQDSLSGVVEPVRILFFTQTFGCEGCEPTRQILDELASLSDKITIEEVNFVLEPEKVAEYGVPQAPALAILGDADYGIRYFGVPAGYEFVALVQAIAIVGARDSGLTPESRARLAEVNAPLAIQVFATPT